MMYKKIRNDAGDGDQLFDIIQLGNTGNTIQPQQNSNQVFFYNDITQPNILQLNKELSDTAKHLQILQINYNLPEPIPVELYISSNGGELLAAISTVDRIKASKVPIHSYVEGSAASAATLISISAHKRFIRTNGFMLIHQLSSGVNWGSFSQIKDEYKNLDLLMKTIKEFYLKHTKLTEKKLNELLKHDLYLDSKECLKLGLVDVII